MINTTLCYIEKDNKYLMLHRIKKENDLNKNKWIGVGGKFEKNETPDECVVREVKEETGLTLKDYTLRGVITFLSDKWEGEYMYLYTATDFEGDIIECNEGKLEWVAKDKILDLPTWEGDKYFLKELLENNQFFTMKLKYAGDNLVDWDIKYHKT